MRVGRRGLVAVVMTLAAACSSGSGDGDDEAAPTIPTDTARPAECLEHGASVPRETPEGTADVYLVDVRVARLDACADEVVFEFRSSGRELPPGYEIEYGEGPFRDFTSGDEFDPAGEAYIVIRFRRTGTVEVVGPPGEQEFSQTYTGRESIDPSDLHHLREARIVEGPVGTTQWVIGVDSERPFTVDASTLPVPFPTETSVTLPEAPLPTSSDPSGPSDPSDTTTTTTLPPGPTSKIVVRIG